MKNIYCVKAKVALRDRSKIEAWLEFLESEKEEVEVSMKEEGVDLEAMFWEVGEEFIYVYYFVHAEDIDRAKEVYRNSVREVDLKHREFQRELFESKEVLEGIYYRKI